MDPYNESPWRYLVGVLREQQQSFRDQGDTDGFASLLVEYQVRSEALRGILTQAHRNPDHCVNMTSARIDLLEMIATKDSIQTAIQLTEGLAKEYDTVRKKYWGLVLRRLRKKIKTTDS